jgi:DNA topoisomerase-1
VKREIHAFQTKLLIASMPYSSFGHQTETGGIESELARRIKTKEKQKFPQRMSGSKLCHRRLLLPARSRENNTPAPFTKSTLQQGSARKLGYTVAQTMMLAQNAYSNRDSYTYMRTDSVNISDFCDSRQ